MQVIDLSGSNADTEIVNAIQTASGASVTFSNGRLEISGGGGSVSISCLLYTSMQLNETIARVRSYCNPDIKVLGAFLTKHNPRTRFSREVEGTLNMVAADLDFPVMNAYIRESVALRERCV